MRILFLTWLGSGNQVPAIGLAQTLAARGHRICFAGYPVQRATFRELGFEFRVLPRSDAAYRADAPPEAVMAELLRGVWACPAQLLDVADLATEGFDLAVVDGMMFGALAALERVRLPAVVLVHSAPGVLAPPGGGGEAFILPALNALRDRAGLDHLDSLWQAWAHYPTICSTLRELDPLADRVPPSFHYVGPIAEARPPALWSPPWPQRDQRPLLLANFSSGFASDQRSRLERTLAAVGGSARYRLLVSASAPALDGLALPRRAVIMPALPEAEVFPRTAVTVTHAGHGTVAAALTHAVPMVFLPNPAADQRPLADRVAGLGAGIVLEPDTATPDEIAAAVARILDRDSYREAARRLSARIDSSTRATGAAERLERLVAAR